MKDKLIILDLDDTLVSTHLRQYICIKDYLDQSGINFADYNTYFELRRTNNFSNTALLRHLQIDTDWDDFKTYYLANIESEKYLSLDELIVNKKHLIRAIKKGFKLTLLSLRSNHVNSNKQLKQLGIADLFEEIYFVYHDSLANPKIEKLKQFKEQYSSIVFCGDSLSDYEAAQQLNINFVQVKTALYHLPDFKRAKQFTNINQYFLTIL